MKVLDFGIEERIQRVLAVVRAGRRIADPADPLGREARERLPSATGLSPASVELALSEHLETRPSSEDLSTLVGRAGSAPRCHVVLSANVCTASLRAFAIACATASRVLAKPSRRDPVVAELIARALDEDGAFAAAHGAIAIVGETTPSPGDELHVYGSDETIAAIRATLPDGVIVRAHGTGFGVAIIDVGAEKEGADLDGAIAEPPDADLDGAADALARDVVAFDQRGCVSPRIAIVIGDLERASRAARSLARALSAWHERTPRGALSRDDLAELRRYTETAAALGACIEGEGFAVGLDEAPEALLLPPAARAIHVVPASAADLPRLLAPWAPKIAAVGLAGRGAAADAIRAIVPSARFSKLGFMQRPPLDGPVDLRSMMP